jgi:hypothetical protein
MRIPANAPPLVDSHSEWDSFKGPARKYSNIYVRIVRCTRLVFSHVDLLQDALVWEALAAACYITAAKRFVCRLTCLAMINI